MADPKPKAKPSVKAEQPTARSFKTAPNVTLLIHPFTQARFTGTALPVEDVDFWIANQVEAGKLVEC